MGRRETLAEFEVFSQFVGQPCTLWESCLLIPQPIWQTFLPPSPLQTLLPPGCNSNLYVNEREKGVYGKRSIFCLAYLVWLLFSESNAGCFLFISREMQRDGNKLSPSVLATWIGTSASWWFGIVPRVCQGQNWVTRQTWLQSLATKGHQVGPGKDLTESVEIGTFPHCHVVILTRWCCCGLTRSCLVYFPIGIHSVQPLRKYCVVCFCRWLWRELF